VQVADAMQQLEPRQEVFAQLMEDGDVQEAVALQRQVIEELEVVQDLDARGYATAQIRRLRRVVDRVESNAVSSTQARLMVGEALHRSNSGDLARLTSPPGTPPARPRDAWDSFAQPLDLDFGEVNSFDPPFPSRLVTSPGSPPALPSLSPPAYLVSDECDRESLPNEFLCPITREVMTDPVVAEDGHSYERFAIRQWFSEGKSTSPKTGLQMPGRVLIANHAMRAQIMTENERRASGMPENRTEPYDSDSKQCVMQ